MCCVEVEFLTYVESGVYVFRESGSEFLILLHLNQVHLSLVNTYLTVQNFGNTFNYSLFAWGKLWL